MFASKKKRTKRQFNSLSKRTYGCFRLDLLSLTMCFKHASNMGSSTFFCVFLFVCWWGGGVCVCGGGGGGGALVSSKTKTGMP